MVAHRRRRAGPGLPRCRRPLLIRCSETAPPTSPWVGLGAGIESATISTSTLTNPNPQSSDGGFSGIEFFNLQLGADYRLGSHFAVDPYATFSLAEYFTVEDNGRSHEISLKATHQWLQLGVKGTFDL